MLLLRNLLVNHTYMTDLDGMSWGSLVFFYFILFFILTGVLFFSKKNIVFSLFFSLSLSLFLSFSVHTLWVLLSLINFTKVSCEGKLKKGVPYKL